MLGIVKEISGQKKIIPLTTDTGTGAPVGTLIQQYKKKPMSGYLYCDGSTFDENAYPALYMYLGTNVLPDYRECVMVGAEQNTTDTIATHDVYGEGEFKDDQIQSHEHNFYFKKTRTNQSTDNMVTPSSGLKAIEATGFINNANIKDIVNARGGETTHGKQKAVYIYIKATSGLAENQQENVLNDVKDYVDNSNSYSMEEVKTGGTWIDGKPIYRKVLTATLQNDEQVLTIEISKQLKSITDIRGILTTLQNVDFPIPYCFVDGSSVNQVYVYCQGLNLIIIPRSTSGNYFKTGCTIRAIIEYTKTTD